MSLVLPSNVALLGSSIDPDAARWIAVVGSANVSQPRGRLVSDTIRALKAANVWAALDFLPVLTAENTASALVDWKNLRTMTATNSPTFVADAGYAFNGTSYINTGFIPSTHATSATGTSQMIGVYERTNVASSGRAFGANVVVPTQSVHILPSNGSNAFATINTANTVYISGATDSRGLFVAAATGTAGAGYKNGVATLTPTLTNPGSSLVNIALFIGGYNQLVSTVPTLTVPRSSTLGYCLYGGNAWSATQHAAFYNVMQRYMRVLGANV